MKETKKYDIFNVPFYKTLRKDLKFKGDYIHLAKWTYKGCIIFKWHDLMHGYFYSCYEYFIHPKLSPDRQDPNRGPFFVVSLQGRIYNKCRSIREAKYRIDRQILINNKEIN